MNKIQIVVDVVLVSAVAALFVLFFTNKPATSQPTCDDTVSASSITLPVAYLNVDSLLEGYLFAQDAREKLEGKQEDARLKLNTKVMTLQKEYEDVQRKINYNAYSSRERAEAAVAKIEQKRNDLQALEAKLTQDILAENQQLNMQLSDSLNAFLKEYNKNGKYQIIFSNNLTDNILMADDAYDITADVVAGMNARYSK